MPAKTVKDLVEFNKSVPDEFKVKVLLKSQGKDYLSAGFVDKSGEVITQHDSRREEYYGMPIDQLEKGSEVSISRYVDPSHKPMFPWGQVSSTSNSLKDIDKCNNAWFVSNSEAAKGYGPMLYDCMLVKLGQFGFGLTADRALVSPLAAKVWVEYLLNRPEVQKKALDFNGSTPEIEDDCFATHEKNPKWNAWINDPEKGNKSDTEYEQEKEKYLRMRTAVKYAYFDDGISTFNELKKEGLLIDQTSKLDEGVKLYHLLFL